MMLPLFFALLASASAFSVSPAVAPRPALSPHTRAAVPQAAGLAFIGQVEEPVRRAIGFLKGEGVQDRIVPCGDDEVDECLALCDDDGCTVIGET